MRVARYRWNIVTIRTCFKWAATIASYIPWTEIEALNKWVRNAQTRCSHRPLSADNWKFSIVWIRNLDTYITHPPFKASTSAQARTYMYKLIDSFKRPASSILSRQYPSIYVRSITYHVFISYRYNRVRFLGPIPFIIIAHLSVYTPCIKLAPTRCMNSQPGPQPRLLLVALLGTCSTPSGA